MCASDNTTPHQSDEYDAQILRTIPFYNEFHEQTIQLISAYTPNPESWLDTGCGTGSLIQKCAQKFKNTNFILSDPSSQILEVAKEKLLPYESRIRFLKPTATQDLKLRGHVNVITAIQAHHYLTAPERKKATDVCYGLLKKGGIFVGFENISPETERGIEIGKKMWGTYQLSCNKSQEEVHAHLERFGKQYYPISVRDHLNLYANCGFKVVEILWFSYLQAGFYCIK